jgi:hypothetical protein
MSKPCDFQVMVALVHQVSKAVPKGGNERDVTTIITRPMWQAFCRATNEPEDSEPTDWLSLASTRVFGSQTIVVESPAWRAVSLVMRPQLGPQTPCPPEPTK